MNDEDDDKEIRPLLRRRDQKRELVFKDKNYYPYIRGFVIGLMFTGSFLYLLSHELIFIILFSSIAFIPFSYYFNKIYLIPNDKRLVAKIGKKLYEIPYENIEVVERKIFSKEKNLWRNVGILIIAIGALIIFFNSLESNVISLYISGFLFIITGITAVFLNKKAKKSIFIHPKININNQPNGIKDHVKISLKSVSKSQEITSLLNILGGEILTSTRKLESHLIKKMRKISLYGIIGGVIGGVLIVLALYSSEFAGEDPIRILLIIGLSVLLLIGIPTGISWAVFKPKTDWSATLRENSLNLTKKTQSKGNKDKLNKPGIDQGDMRVSLERTYYFHNVSSLDIKKVIDKRNLLKGAIIFLVGILLLLLEMEGFFLIALIVILGFSIPFFYGARPQWQINLKGYSGRKDYSLPLKRANKGDSIKIQNFDFIRELNKGYTESISQNNSSPQFETTRKAGYPVKASETNSSLNN